VDNWPKELLSVLGYAAVAFFCGLCGLLLSYISTVNMGEAGIGEFPEYVNRYRLEVVYFYGVSLFSFLVARAFTVDSAKGVDNLDRIKIINWIAILVILVSFLSILFRVAPSGSLERFFYPASSVFAFLYILFRTNRVDEDDGAEQRSYCFTNRIFFPAITTCISSFLVGWFVIDVEPNSWAVLPATAIALCLLMSFSGRSAGSSKRAIVFFALMLILVPIIPKFFTSAAAAVGLPFSIFIAFALGVTEVANRNYHICKEDSTYRLSCHEEAEFYSAGANWSAFVFIPLVPTLALFLPILPVWVLYAYALVFILIWALTKDKVTPQFRTLALLLGLSLPLTILGGVLIGIFRPDWILVLDEPVTQTGDVTRQANGALSDRITTILGVLLTIIFVLLQSKYEKFMKSLRRSNTFLSIRNCMLLFFLIMSLVNVYALFVTSVLDRIFSVGDSGWRKIDEFQIWSLVLIAVILVVYMWEGEPGEDADGTGGAGGSGPGVRDIDGQNGGEGAAEEATSSRTAPAWTSAFARIANYVAVGRGTTSLIAGAATSGILFFGLDEVNWSVINAGAVILLITMFGFVENDISDRYKDRQGQRGDKLLVSGGVGVGEAKGVALVLASCSWVLGYFAFGTGALAFLTVLAIALSVYSAFSHRLPLFKGLYTACLCMSPAWFVNIVAGTEVISPYVVAFGIVFFVGRELAIDSKDAAADRLAGMKTLAVVLGPRLSTICGWTAMAAAFLILALAVGTEGRLLAATGLGLLIVLGIYSSVNPVRAIRWSRVALLFGVFSVGVSL
jgi:4-hydroxybenzoate polyprenyltransferase